MDKYIAYFKSDNFARQNGCEMLECGPGKAKVQVVITPKHLNGAGVVHGGLIFTLADFTFAVATNAYGKVALSIENSISYFEKSTSGVITATASIISKSNKLIRGMVDVKNEDDKLLARFNGTAYITRETIDF